MTPVSVAERLEHYAREVEQLRGVSRRNPHAFVEDKSDLAGRMREEARALRTPAALPIGAGAVTPHVIRQRGRAIPVEVRRRPARPQAASGV